MRSTSVRGFHKWGFFLAVAAAFTLPAMAQASKGEFTIPREVHWGTLVLPAGSYSYSVEHHASEVLLLRPKTGSGGHFLLASAVSRPDMIMPNQLTMEQHGTKWYVTSMVVNDLGEVLLFQAPADTTGETGAKLATIATK